MMTDLRTVRIERPEPGVAILRLHRPGQLNALVAAMFTDIRAACEQLQADESVNAIVLTGSGRGFCAGYDLDEARELAQLSPAAMLARQDLAAGSGVALRRARPPVL